MTETSNIRTGLRAVIATAVLAAAFVLPAQAMASDCSNATSDPTQAQYCSPSAVQQSGNNNAAPATAAAISAPSASESSSLGSLPFTGLDLAVLLAVAVVLTGTGLGLRRLSASGGEKS